ncbi:hypothetical protein ONZ45_g12677 [Pleurotus djamor]|nr:hypothetical protein ONZ45_g12677 [Pleurotus djamor]
MAPNTRTNRSKRKVESDPVDEEIVFLDEDPIDDDFVMESPAKPTPKTKRTAKPVVVDDDDVFVVNMDEEESVTVASKTTPKKKKAVSVASGKNSSGSGQATGSRSPTKRELSPEWDETVLESPSKKGRIRKLSSAAKAAIEESASPVSNILKSIHLAAPESDGSVPDEVDDDAASVADSLPELETPTEEDVASIPSSSGGGAVAKPSAPRMVVPSTKKADPVLPKAKTEILPPSSKPVVTEKFEHGWRQRYEGIGFPNDLDAMEDSLRKMVTSGAVSARRPLVFPQRTIQQHAIRTASLYDLLPMVPNNFELLHVMRALTFERRGVFINPALGHPSLIQVIVKPASGGGRFMSLFMKDPAVGYGKRPVFVSTVALSSVNFHSALLPSNWVRPVRAALAPFFDEEVARIGGFFGGVFSAQDVSALPLSYIDGFMSFQTVPEGHAARQSHPNAVAPSVMSPKKSALFKKVAPSKFANDDNATLRAFPENLGFDDDVPVYDLRRLQSPIDFNTDEGWETLLSCPRLQLGCGQDELGFEDDPAIAMLAYGFGTFPSKQQSLQDDNGCLNIMFVAILARASSSNNGIPTKSALDRLSKMAEQDPGRLRESVLKVVKGKLAFSRVS